MGHMKNFTIHSKKISSDRGRPQMKLALLQKLTVKLLIRDRANYRAIEEENLQSQPCLRRKLPQHIMMV